MGVYAPMTASRGIGAPARRQRCARARPTSNTSCQLVLANNRGNNDAAAVISARACYVCGGRGLCGRGGRWWLLVIVVVGWSLVVVVGWSLCEVIVVDC